MRAKWQRSAADAPQDAGKRWVETQPCPLGVSRSVGLGKSRQSSAWAPWGEPAMGMQAAVTCSGLLGWEQSSWVCLVCPAPDRASGIDPIDFSVPTHALNLPSSIPCKTEWFWFFTLMQCLQIAAFFHVSLLLPLIVIWGGVHWWGK